MWLLLSHLALHNSSRFGFWFEYLLLHFEILLLLLLQSVELLDVLLLELRDFGGLLQARVVQYLILLLNFKEVNSWKWLNNLLWDEPEEFRVFFLHYL